MNILQDFGYNFTTASDPFWYSGSTIKQDIHVLQEEKKKKI
jgi:hypothetical protein